jgi:hypothetical protein
MKLTLLLTCSLLCLAFMKPGMQHLATAADPGPGQFDFWVGEWDLSWNDTAKGTNVIRKEMNGYVIQENFNDPAGGFLGKSWSVYDTAAHLWRQTWVDNQGGYITLTGIFDAGKMILTTQPVEKNGKKILSRMVFFNIAADSFDWWWEHSTDAGTNWKTAWKIHYLRKK